MTTATIRGPAQHHGGPLRVPGDKSVSHRALLLAALADGESVITNLAPGGDVRSTANCLRQLGVRIDVDGSTARVHGVGLHGLKKPAAPLDCGNSGSSMRMLSGVLAGAGIDATLVGDESLSKRPMKRVAEPLGAMGAKVGTTEGHSPLTVSGRATSTLRWQSIPPSAQVKTAVLLAGLFTEGETRVDELFLTRDHTERLLGAFGAEVRHVYEAPLHSAMVRGPAKLRASNLEVPGDLSSAAFLLAAGAVCRGPGVSVQGVGVNPTRTGFLDALALLDIHAAVSERVDTAGEPTATLTVKPPWRMVGARLDEDLVGRAIDEVPLLAVLCALSTGESEIRGAAELRVKESDRLAATAKGLAAMGAHVRELEDGLVIGRRDQPSKLHGATIDSHGDHRIAMAFAIAALAAEGETTITGAEWVDISFPGFWSTLRELTLGAVRVSE